MFSSMIQNLLSSSGKASAMQRAVQMNNYVNNLTAEWTPVEKQAENTDNKVNSIQSFDNVLKSSAKTKFGDLLTNPATRVNASLYTNTAKGAADTEKITTREQIKNLASPHDNTTGLWRVGNEEALVHLGSQYPWLIFRGDVCARGLGFGFGYNHGGEIPVFF